MQAEQEPTHQHQAAAIQEKMRQNPHHEVHVEQVQTEVHEMVEQRRLADERMLDRVRENDEGPVEVVERQMGMPVADREDGPDRFEGELINRGITSDDDQIVIGEIAPQNAQVCQPHDQENPEAPLAHACLLVLRISAPTSVAGSDPTTVPRTGPRSSRERSQRPHPLCPRRTGHSLTGSLPYPEARLPPGSGFRWGVAGGVCDGDFPEHHRAGHA